MSITDFLTAFTSSKEAWVYLLAGEMALLFNICSVPLLQSRLPRPIDLYAFLVWSLFVIPTVVLIDFSPFASLIVGWACQPLWAAIQRSLTRLAPDIANMIIGRGGGGGGFSSSLDSAHPEHDHPQSSGTGSVLPPTLDLYSVIGPDGTHPNPLPGSHPSTPQEEKQS